MAEHDQAVWDRLRKEYRKLALRKDFDEGKAKEFIESMYNKYAKVDVGKYKIVDGPIDAMKAARDLGYQGYVPCSWHGNLYDFLWQARYQYDIEMGLEKPHEEIDAYINGCQASNLAGGVYNYKLGIIIRPFKSVFIDDQMRLHNTDGPALEAHDGFKLFCLDNIDIEPEIFIPAFIDGDIEASKILGMNNVEAKTAVLKYYGVDKMFDQLKGRCIDTMVEPSCVDGKPCSYELWDFTYEGTDLRCVVVECHSEHKRTPLIIPREDRLNTCFKAIPWTFDPDDRKGWVSNPSLYWDNLVHQS